MRFRKYKVTSDVEYKVPDKCVRYVSPKEYAVLEKLAKQGKLDVMGFPKDDAAFDEYQDLMAEEYK